MISNVDNATFILISFLQVINSLSLPRSVLTGTLFVSLRLCAEKYSNGHPPNKRCFMCYGFRDRNNDQNNFCVLGSVA